MGKSQQTFNKKEREKKKRKKKQEKAERRQQRKMEKELAGKKTLEEQFMYVDENGNLTSTPPDPNKKSKVKAADIPLGVPQNSKEAISKYRKGKVKFFNQEKGFGFIIDSGDQQSIFVHANNADFPIKEHDKVTFEIEKGPKGATAVRVKLL